MTRTDYESMAARYDRGRALSPERIEDWRVTLDPYLSRHPGRILDLGSGTGLWSELLATWFGSEVMAVEPSDAMRRQAATRAGARVSLIGGLAERIPLADACCDHAWLSTVLHHVEDVPACARELRRVLRGGGAVLIRNSFGDRLEGIRWLEFFPEARALAGRRWPTVGSTTSLFEAAGFEADALESVEEIIADNFIAYRDRIAVRANSTLNLIEDEEFAEGLGRMEAFARTRSSSEKVVDRRDLLVLRAR